MPRFLETAGRRLGYAISLPERTIRAFAASVGGLVYESTEVLLPGWLRRSRFYQGLIADLLRIVIELVGGVSGVLPPRDIGVRELTMRKAASTGIGLAGGWFPLWLFAVAADLTGGTRTYLHALVSELKRDDVLHEDAEITSLEELLNTLEGTSGLMADVLDEPPLNVDEMRSSWQEMRMKATGLPDASHLESIYRDLQNVAIQEDRSLQSVSSLIATGALQAGVQLGHSHIFDYYQDALGTINTEGLPVYSRRVTRPYFAAAISHFDPERITITERSFGRRNKMVDNSVIDSSNEHSHGHRSN
ncbi:MAG: hypothetical protein ABUK20_13545 [Anaerolineales bacterium]